MSKWSVDATFIVMCNIAMHDGKIMKITDFFKIMEIDWCLCFIDIWHK
jgi:hypothetical protein